MELSRIICISGKPGLYKLLNKSKKGFIIQDLIKNKKISINANYNVSLLENVSIYGIDKEYPIAEVFQKLKQKNEDYTEIRNNKEKIRILFKEILPNYDENRVYDSDIKKILSWYDILNKIGIIK